MTPPWRRYLTAWQINRGCGLSGFIEIIGKGGVSILGYEWIKILGPAGKVPGPDRRVVIAVDQNRSEPD
jgi:hypothetical protein